jgi:hypothetical protein
MHPSSFRSFPLNCTIYNPDAKKAVEFAVECFLDTSPRWVKYSPPKAGSLAHVVGNLLGLFEVGQTKTPALHITDWKNLSTVERTLAAAEPLFTAVATTPKRRKMLPPGSSTETSPAKRQWPSAAASSSESTATSSMQLMARDADFDLQNALLMSDSDTAGDSFPNEDPPTSHNESSSTVQPTNLLMPLGSSPIRHTSRQQQPTLKAAQKKRKQKP